MVTLLNVVFYALLGLWFLGVRFSYITIILGILALAIALLAIVH